jgi:hypothetical protein
MGLRLEMFLGCYNSVLDLILRFGVSIRDKLIGRKLYSTKIAWHCPFCFDICFLRVELLCNVSMHDLRSLLTRMAIQFICLDSD